jgi:hypothetical protein
LGVWESLINNASIFTADRMTHLKTVALICATVVAGIGIAARETDGTTAGSRLEPHHGLTQCHLFWVGYPWNEAALFDARKATGDGVVKQEHGAGPIPQAA